MGHFDEAAIRPPHRLSIIASQCPIGDWHPNIGDPTLVDAVCGRLLHNTYRIELRGDSMRTRAGSTSENKGKEVIVNDSELSETIAIPAPLPEPFLQGGRFGRTSGRFHWNPQSIYEENILSINQYIY